MNYLLCYGLVLFSSQKLFIYYPKQESRNNASNTNKGNTLYGNYVFKYD